MGGFNWTKHLLGNRIIAVRSYRPNLMPDSRLQAKEKKWLISSVNLP
jgi:hypothetical protein